jgi:hypothetical protein
MHQLYLSGSEVYVKENRGRTFQNSNIKFQNAECPLKGANWGRLGLQFEI